MPRPGSSVVHPDWAANNRPAAESVLTDRCTITRPGAPATAFDPVTGAVGSPVPVTVATDVACRVSYDTTTPRRQNFAEETIESARHLVELPYSHTDVQPDDVVTITASDDPAQVGRNYKVIKDGAATYTWTRLLRCEHTD